MKLTTPISQHLVDRFWSRVNRDGPVPQHRPELGVCWLWTGSVLKREDGEISYGYFSLGKNHHILAHQFSWTLAHGPIEDGINICHKCDLPPCIRESHLFDGTQAENLADMRAKGRAKFNRFPAGVDHPNAKITPTIVRQICDLRASGLSLAKIGAIVDLHASSVHDIVTGKTWCHI